jgi:hypothetical protein
VKFPGLFAKHICRSCKHRNAKFTFRGQVKWDCQHDICNSCYRKLRDQNAAVQLGAYRSPVFSFEMSGYFYRQALEQPPPTTGKLGPRN